MTDTTPITIPAALTETLRSAKSITVLTGAGISAESGIPTFRDSQTGIWERYDPHELATPQAFSENPLLVLDWYRWRRQLVSQAAPNPGHAALAAMQRNVPRFTLITQNVDGLHVLAGSSNIIELHGSLLRLRCANPACDYATLEWAEEGIERCPRCQSLLRPDVVWFGEVLPSDALEAAVQASRDCEVFFSVGTSGVVEPAASLPYEALRAGATMVEINPKPTPLSVHSKYYFAHPAGIVLPQIIRAVWDPAED